MAFGNMANTHLKKTLDDKKKEGKKVSSGNATLDERIEKVQRIEDANNASEIMRKAAETKVNLGKVRPNIQKVTDRDSYDSRVRQGYAERNRDIIDRTRAAQLANQYTREELEDKRKASSKNANDFYSRYERGMTTAEYQYWQDNARNDEAVYKGAIDILSKREDRKKQAEAENKDKKYSTIEDYKPVIGMSKEEYSRRASADAPAYGSYSYFEKREKEVGDRIRELNDKITYYTVQKGFTEKTYTDYIKNPDEYAAKYNNKYLMAEIKNFVYAIKERNTLAEEYKQINSAMKTLEDDNMVSAKGGDWWGYGRPTPRQLEQKAEIDHVRGERESQNIADRSAVLARTAELGNGGDWGDFGRPTPRELEQRAEIKHLYGKSQIAGEKEKAYRDYGEHKDDVYDDNIIGRVKGNYKIGQIGEDAAAAGFTAYDNKSMDIGANLIYQTLQQKIQANNIKTFTNDTEFQKSLANIAGYIPQGMNQIKASVSGGIMGAVYGGILSLGNPAIAKTAANIGAASASADYMYKQTAGNLYVQYLMETDLPVEDIRTMTHNTAIASAAVEFGLEFIGNKILTAGGTKVKGAIKNAIKNIPGVEDMAAAFIKRGLSVKGAKTAVKVGIGAAKAFIDSLGEGAEEWLQAGLEKTAMKEAQKGEVPEIYQLFLRSFDMDNYTDEDFAEMNDNFKAGFIIGFFGAGAKSASQNSLSIVGKLLDSMNERSRGKAVIKANKGDVSSLVKNALASENEEMRDLGLLISRQVQDGRVSQRDTGRLAMMMFKEGYNPFTGKKLIASEETIPQSAEQTAPFTQGSQENVPEVPESVESAVKDTEKNVKVKSSSKELISKLVNAIPQLENDDIVYNATGDEFKPGKRKLSEQVYDFFRSIGGKIYRNGFGDILLDEAGVDSSIAHGMGRAKAITFASVPEVIKNGKQIDYQRKWKGRNYDSYVFAAPVQVGNLRSYVAVVVTRSDMDSRYYVHEVVDDKGNIIYIKKDDTSFKSKSETDNGPLGEASSTDTIPQQEPGVNKNNFGIVADKVSAQFGVRNPEEYRAINKIAKDLGIKVIFEELDGEDGYYDPKTGELHINIYAENPINIIKKHEITHTLEGTDEYNELINFAKENMAEEWAAKEREITDLYERVNKKRAAAGKATIELTAKRLESETMAELTERFVSDETLEMISKENPSLMEKVIDFIREIMTKLKNAISPQELSVYELAEQKWLAAYESVKENGAVKKGEIGYKLSENAREEVRKVLHDKKYAGEVKLTDESPAILLSQKGVKNLPMVMKASHIRENIFTEEQARKKGLKVNPNINYHGLGEELFLKVIAELDDVNEAYRGTKNADIPERRENYFLLISQYTDKGGNVINVPVYINEKGLYNRVFIDTNKIATVYGKNNLKNYIREQIDKGNLVRVKIKSIRTSESTSPINADYETNASNNSIYQIEKKSQENFSNNQYSDTKKHKLQDPEKFKEVDPNNIIDYLNAHSEAQAEEALDYWESILLETERFERENKVLREVLKGTEYDADVNAHVKNEKYEVPQSSTKGSDSGTKYSTELLEKYNHLKRLNEQLLGKVSITDVYTRNPGHINNIAYSIKKKYGIRMRTKAIAEMIQGAVNSFIDEKSKNNHIISPEINSAFMKELYDAGIKMAENGKVDRTLEYEHKEFIDEVRKTPVSISKEAAKNIKGGFFKFKRSLGKGIRLDWTADLDITEFYEKLCKKYPDVQLDTTLTNPEEMLTELKRKLDCYTPTLMDMDIENAGSVIALDIYNEIFRGDAKSEQTAVESIKKGFMKEYDKERKTRALMEKALMLVKYLKNDRMTKVLSENNPEWQETMEKIMGIDDLGISIREVGYKRKDGTWVWGKYDLSGLAEKWNEIMPRDADGDILSYNKTLEEKITRLNKKQIADMSNEELADLIKVMYVIKKSVENSKKLLAQEKETEILSTATQVREEIYQSRCIKGKAFISTWTNKNSLKSLTPERQAKRITGGKQGVFCDIVRALTIGERKMIQFFQRTEQHFTEVVGNKKEMEWLSKEGITIKYNTVIRETGKDDKGNPIFEKVKVNGSVVITPAMRISLYLQAQCRDNLRHMLYGGVEFPDIKKYSKGDFNNAYSNYGNGSSPRIFFSVEELQNIFADMTEFEKEFAEITSKWLNGMCKIAINAVSRKMYGYDAAPVKNYFPIVTDKRYIESAFVNTKGMTAEGGKNKSRESGSISPILLVDVLRVIEQEKNRTGRYWGLAIPIRDFKMVWNTRFGYNDSIKNAMDNVWGSLAVEYFENMIMNLNGSKAKVANGDELIAKLKSKYAGTTLTINPFSAVKQVSGWMLALPEFGFSAFKGLKFTKNDKEIMNRYSPIIWHRMQGYSKNDIADFVYGKPDWMQKLPWLWNTLQLTDTLVCESFWNASKAFINKKIKNGEILVKVDSDEYWKMVADKFNDVIEKTQNASTIMGLPEVMRNSSEFYKSSFLLFKGAPLQMYNMAYEAVLDWSWAIKTGNKTVAKKHFGKLAGTVSAILLSQVAEVSLDIVRGRIWGKKKEDDEEDEERKLLNFTKDVLGNLIGTNYVGSIFVDCYEKLSNGWSYDMGVAGMSAVSDVVTLVYNSGELIFEEKEKDTRKYVRLITNQARSIGVLTNLPIKNIIDIIHTVERGVIGAVNMAGYDTTMAEYELMKIWTPISDKKEYGSFLRDTITAARDSKDKDKQKMLYKDAQEIADDLKRLVGEKYVYNILKKAGGSGYSFEDMTDVSYMNSQLSSGVSDEIKKYTKKATVVPEISEEGIEDAGAVKLTYGKKEFTLTPVQEAKYNRIAKDWETDAYNRIIKDGEMINSTLYGKSVSELSDQEKKSISKYYYNKYKRGEMTEKEARGRLNEIKAGKHLAPTNFGYYHKDLTYEEMTDEQRDATLKYYYNKYKSGEMTNEEAQECLKEIKAGTMTKRFKVYYPEYYKDLTDEEKTKILNKIKSMSKDYAKEQMKAELVGD